MVQSAKIIGFMQRILDFFAMLKVKMAVVCLQYYDSLGLEMAKKQYPFTF
ncbi:hypothetical protein [Pelosinus sp. HCF1]|jgi:hypothetical protein|nr:hypothetical protein [Pelosinus sp. HCF1]